MATSQRAAAYSDARMGSSLNWLPRRRKPRQRRVYGVTMSIRQISQNILLDALPEEVWQRLSPHLECVVMPVGQALHESGTMMQYAYFPASSIVSMLYVTENGVSTELALVGSEGMVGVSLFLGGETTFSQAWVQSAGRGFRLPARRLKEEFDRAGPAMQVLLRYTRSLIGQIVQTAACNRHDNLEQRLCRWLLLTLDRLPGTELAVTHELISNMLGVRREGVTEAAGRLQQQGVIRYHRGHVIVLDRRALEQHVCNCYMAIKRETDRLLPHSNLAMLRR